METELVGVGRQIEAHRLDMLERERAKEKGEKGVGVGERDIEMDEGTCQEEGWESLGEKDFDSTSLIVRRTGFFLMLVISGRYSWMCVTW